MTEKQFEIFPQNITKDGTLIIIQKGVELYNINDIVELLNDKYKCPHCQKQIHFIDFKKVEE